MNSSVSIHRGDLAWRLTADNDRERGGRVVFLSVGRYYQYIRYVAIHKWHVFQASREFGVPWLGLLHDNSKFLPDEIRPYARHFYEADGAKRTRRAADGFYDDVKNDRAFDRAWLKHIQRNRHHPQHWVEVTWTPCHHDPSLTLLKDDGQAKCLVCGAVTTYDEIGPKYRVGGTQIVILEMPERYRREMLADWRGAGLAQGTPNTLAWYSVRGKRLPLGPETRTWVERTLGYGAAPHTWEQCPFKSDLNVHGGCIYRQEEHRTEEGVQA
jgi:hypothetical protein